MRSFVVRMLVVVCGLGLSLMLGSGVASAKDPFVGRTYSQAVEVISKQNGTPVVATVSGSVLELDDCVVTSWAQNIFLDTDGNNSRRKEFRLNLNCNNPVASPGHPGNSAMTPEGVKAKKDQRTAISISKDPAICDKSDDAMTWCINLCERTGLCEVGAA